MIRPSVRFLDSYMNIFLIVFFNLDEVEYTFGSSCYLFGTVEVDFPTAKADCESSGHHLVYIETSEEQSFLETTMANINPDRNYWIGLETNDNRDQVWMDGSAITYSNLAAINDGGECFRMLYSDNYLWHDQVPSTEEGYICEGAIGEYIILNLLLPRF